MLSKKDKVLRKLKLINAAIKYIKETGKMPSAQEYPYYHAVSLFGSWNTFLEACDQKIRPTNRIDGETLIRQCLILYKKLGRTPFMREFDGYSDTHSHSTVIRLFGSWNKFIEVCGLPLNRERRTVIYKNADLKLSNEVRKPTGKRQMIKGISDTGELKVYNSIAEAAKDNGVTQSAISKSITGNYKMRNGFKWEKYKGDSGD